MSHRPIPSGVNTSPAGQLFKTDELILSEYISADFNAAIRLINGGLTDANVRAKEVGYTGIPEARVTFASTDEIGHSHDGVTSSSLAPGCVQHPMLGDDQGFLMGPYENSPADNNRLLLCCGKYCVKWSSDQGLYTPSIVVPYNIRTFTMLPTPLVKAMAVAWFIPTQPDYDVDRIACDAAYAGYLYDGFGTKDFSLTFRVNLNEDMDFDSGRIGLNWVCVIQGTHNSHLS